MDSQVIFVFRNGEMVDIHYNVEDYQKALTEIQDYASKRKIGGQRPQQVRRGDQVCQREKLPRTSRASPQ